MDDTPILVITVTSISEVATVHLYGDTLLHVEDHHPEVQPLLPSIIAAVEAAIIGPSSVEQDRPNTYVFVDENSTNAEGDPLRVAVRLVPNTQRSARVTTFYFASTEYVPNVVYRREGG
jgi:hypothetical protein